MPNIISGALNKTNLILVFAFLVFISLFAIVVCASTFTDTSSSDFDAGDYNQTESTADGNVILSIEVDINYYPAGDFNSQIFDAGEDVNWQTLQWSEGGYYGEELGDNNCAVQQLDGNMCGNVLLLHLEDDVVGASQVIEDTSGEGNNGTTFGDTNCSVLGKLGSYACNFDGDGDYINIPHSASIDFSDESFTVALWIAPAEARKQEIISKKESTHKSKPGFRVHMTNKDKIRGKLSDGSKKYKTTSKTKLQANQYYHIAVVFDRSSNILIYLDGLLDKTGSDITGCGDINNTQPLLVAALAGKTDFNGTFDEVAIWNRALSADEILDIYKRSALKLKLQSRSCDDANCAGEIFVGPEGTPASYFNDGNTSYDLNIVHNNRYFQYRAVFETDDTNSLKGTTPQLSDVTISYSVSPPSTSWDGNHNTWQSYDANIQLSCYDSGSGCSVTKYRLDTDSSVTCSYGPWQDYDTNILVSADGNWCIDFNSTDVAGNVGDVNTFYVLIGKTAPIVTITSPASDAISTGVSYTITYSGSAVSGIKQYWVSENNTDWTASSQTTYAIIINAASSLPAAHTFYVKLEDNMDQNSSTASVTITFTSASGGGSIPLVETSLEEEGIEGLLVKEGKEIRSTSHTYFSGAETGDSIDVTLYAEELAGRRMATLEELEFSRSIRTIPLVKGTEITGYRNFFTLKVSNLGGMEIKDIVSIEEIPKEIAESAADIISDQTFSVLKEDPLIMFSIYEIGVGESYDFNYSINTESYIEDELFASMLAPIAFIALTEEDPCKGVRCNDFNPCTTDLCGEGKCIFENKLDYALCGDGLVCIAGECVEKPQIAEKITPSEHGLLTFPPISLDSVVVLCMLCVLIIVAYLVICNLLVRKQENP